MFSNSNGSTEIDDNTLHYELFSVNDQTIISSKTWTLKFKPPSHNDALSFINKLKNVRYRIQFQFENNNLIDKIRRNLLSLSLPVGNDLNFFASESNIILEPLKKPPSYMKALKWLETRYSKNKHKKKTIQNNKRKGLITPESLSKSILLKKVNHSTPNYSQNKLYNSSPNTSIRRENNKCLKSKRKLSTLFLDSLNVRKFVLLLQYIYKH